MDSELGYPNPLYFSRVAPYGSVGLVGCVGATAVPGWIFAFRSPTR